MNEPKMNLGQFFANIGGFEQNFKLIFWVGLDLGKYKVY